MSVRRKLRDAFFGGRKGQIWLWFFLNCWSRLCTRLLSLASKERTVIEIDAKA
jgi:hypothetical protein